MPCIVSHAVRESAIFSAKRDPARQYEVKLGLAGHEHTALALSKTPISGEDGAKSDARRGPKAQNQPTEPPPVLAEIMAKWPTLQEHIRAAIKALVQTAEGSQG